MGMDANAYFFYGAKVEGVQNTVDEEEDEEYGFEDLYTFPDHLAPVQLGELDGFEPPIVQNFVAAKASLVSVYHQEGFKSLTEVLGSRGISLEDVQYANSTWDEEIAEWFAENGLPEPTCSVYLGCSFG